MSQPHIQNQNVYNNCCRIIFGDSYFFWKDILQIQEIMVISIKILIFIPFCHIMKGIGQLEIFRLFLEVHILSQ